MQAPGLRRASAGVLAVWLALLCMVTGVVEADQSAFLCSADSGATFMRCLNQTADLNVPVVLTIEGEPPGTAFREPRCGTLHYFF